MKRRLMTAALVLPFLLWLSALLAYNLHLLLMQQTAFVWRPVMLLSAILEFEKVRLFFLAFSGVSLLLLLACLGSGGTGVKYRNSTMQIAPDIRIPVASGSGEYGTARFMSNRELRKAFALRRLPELKEFQKEEKQCEQAKKAAQRIAAGLEAARETLR